ncbi:Tuberin isoform X2 [Oopsacas minuta]|uniref:Tuberin isoform X2 n=1 Tax=Oopsacas minuta TaxID=111878 RepID=A0AAV7JTQ6_9METZ|nr:Tuberin isoform X2 [Oopsacas minuta]
MASLTNMRKLTKSEPGLPDQFNLSQSGSFSPSHSVRSMYEVDEIEPIYWQQNRTNTDSDDGELDPDNDEEFSEEFALKSPPQECQSVINIQLFLAIRQYICFGLSKFHFQVLISLIFFDYFGSFLISLMNTESIRFLSTRLNHICKKSMESLPNKEKKSSGTLNKFLSMFKVNTHQSQGQFHQNEREIIQRITNGHVLSMHDLDPLNQDQLLERRCDILHHLGNSVATRQIPTQTVDNLMDTIVDLLDANHSTHIRRAVLSFLCDLTTGQYAHLPLRGRILNILIKQPLQPDEGDLKMKLLAVVTRNALDVADLSDEILSFLYKILDSLDSVPTDVFISILISFITNEMNDIPEESLSELISKVANRSLGSVTGEEHNFLPFFHDIISNIKIPRSCLPALILALCYNVNLSQHSEESWNITKLTIVSCQLSPVVRSLCDQIEQSYSSHEKVDGEVTRGAILLLSYSLWGPHAQPDLMHYFSNVLSYILRAIRCSPHPSVWYEICLSINSLVQKYGYTINNDKIWEKILNICHNLKTLIFPNLKNSPEVIQTFKQLLASLENFCFSDEISYFKQRPLIVLQLFEEMRPYHSEANVIAFINYKTRGFHFNTNQWIEKLYNFALSFFIQESRVNVRIRSFQVIREQFYSACNMYGDQLLRDVILHMFTTFPHDPPQVKLSLIHFVTDLCAMKTNYFDTLFSILSQPLEKEHLKRVEFESHSKVLLAVVEGMCQTFHKKMDHSSSKHVLLIYIKLIESLENIYNSESIYKQPLAIALRGNIFVTLLSLRADPKGYVGYQKEGGTIRYSSHLHCGNSEPKSTTSHLASPVDPNSLPPKATTLDSNKLFEKVIMLAFTREHDYGMLQCVFRHLNDLLYNKIWVLSGEINLNTFCEHLITLTNFDNILLSGYEYRDFSASAYLTLIPITSYMNLLDPNTQNKLILALVNGVMDIKSSANEECLDALTICSVETPGILTRYIADIIDNLKRLSNVKSMAVPILKFLSLIIHVPELYSDFTHQQYMIVLALTKSFTDSQVFTRYVVSLAYQMIGAWFIRSRLQFRKKLAAYLIKSFSKNLDEPYMGPDYSSIKLPSKSQDKHRALSTSELPRHPDYTADLKQACMDMLVRYCYSNTSTHIDRSPLADYLLSGGQYKTWMIGSILVTIQTSSGVEGEEREGTCERCNALQTLNHTNTPLFNQTASEHLSPNAKACFSAEQTDTAVVDTSNCSCWCKGWAEVKVRRPTGDCNWLMRIQNRLNIYRSPNPGEPICLAAFIQDINLPKTSRSSSSDSREGTPTLLMRSIKSTTPSPLLVPKHNSSPDLNDTNQHISIDSESLVHSDSDRTEHSVLPGDSSSLSIPTSPVSPPLSLTPLLSYERDILQTESINNSSGIDETPLGFAGNRNSPLLTSSPPQIVKPRSNSTDSDHFSSQSSSPPLSVTPSSTICRSHSPEAPGGNKRFRFTPSEYEPHSTSLDQPAIRTSDTDPSFIFLQLYQGGQFGNMNTPILLDCPQVEEKLRKQTKNSIKVLDLILPFYNHALGVIYMDHGQTTERQLLNNTRGSERYNKFLCGLGEFIDVSNSDKYQLWVGGLQSDDCRYTFHWQDDITQVAFHIATFMSNLPHDPGCTNKKRHIGNDNVIIIYKDSTRPYQQGLITSEKTLVEIVIEPLPCLLNKITVLYKEDIEGIQALRSCYAVDSVLAIYVRQLAILSDVAVKLSRGEPSNWVARLQLIKKIRERHEAGQTLPETPADFTLYT